MQSLNSAAGNAGRMRGVVTGMTAINAALQGVISARDEKERNEAKRKYDKVVLENAKREQEANKAAQAAYEKEGFTPAGAAAIVAHQIGSLTGQDRELWQQQQETAKSKALDIAYQREQPDAFKEGITRTSQEGQFLLGTMPEGVRAAFAEEQANKFVQPPNEHGPLFRPPNVMTGGTRATAPTVGFGATPPVVGAERPPLAAGLPRTNLGAGLPAMMAPPESAVSALPPVPTTPLRRRVAQVATTEGLEGRSKQRLAATQLRTAELTEQKTAFDVGTQKEEYNARMRNLEAGTQAQIQTTRYYAASDERAQKEDAEKELVKDSVRKAAEETIKERTDAGTLTPTAARNLQLAAKTGKWEFISFVGTPDDVFDTYVAKLSPEEQTRAMRMRLHLYGKSDEYNELFDALDTAKAARAAQGNPMSDGEILSSIAGINKMVFNGEMSPDVKMEVFRQFIERSSLPTKEKERRIQLVMDAQILGVADATTLTAFQKAQLAEKAKDSPTYTDAEFKAKLNEYKEARARGDNKAAANASLDIVAMTSPASIAGLLMTQEKSQRTAQGSPTQTAKAQAVAKREFVADLKQNAVLDEFLTEGETGGVVFRVAKYGPEAMTRMKGALYTLLRDYGTLYSGGIPETVVKSAVNIFGEDVIVPILSTLESEDIGIWQMGALGSSMEGTQDTSSGKEKATPGGAGQTGVTTPPTNATPSEEQTRTGTPFVSQFTDEELAVPDQMENDLLQAKNRPQMLRVWANIEKHGLNRPYSQNLINRWKNKAKTMGIKAD